MDTTEEDTYDGVRLSTVQICRAVAFDVLFRTTCQSLLVSVEVRLQGQGGGGES